MPRPCIALAALLLLIAPRPAAAVFHFAVIDEVMTSYEGDTAVQFVEIQMLSGSQTLVADSVLGVFDATGAFVDEALVVPGNISNSGSGLRWIMGTPELETAAGIQVDFEFPAGLIPQSGMVCWGAPGVFPPPPASWDHTDPESYVDCVAYGAYTGPTNDLIGTPTPISPDGHSIRRISETHDNATDFACGDPADPTNNAAQSGSLAATTSCVPEPGAAALLLVGAAALAAAGTLRGARRRAA